MGDDTVDLPVGSADLDSQPYWRALRRHELRVQRCVACGRHRFPPMPSCPYCAAEEAGVVAIAGGGVVYSWVTVHHPFSDRMAGEVPYQVAVVELPELCRVLGRIDGPAVAIGDAVEPRYVDHDRWTELRFARSPADDDGRSRPGRAGR